MLQIISFEWRRRQPKLMMNRRGAKKKKHRSKSLCSNKIILCRCRDVDQEDDDDDDEYLIKEKYLRSLLSK